MFPFFACGIFQNKKTKKLHKRSKTPGSGKNQGISNNNYDNGNQSVPTMTADYPKTYQAKHGQIHAKRIGIVKNGGNPLIIYK
jgi:hypothetical protein